MEYRVILLVVTLLIGAFSSTNGQAAMIDEQCQVAPRERINCGYPGITPDECFKAGCCFSDADVDAAWCFYARSDNNECED